MAYYPIISGQIRHKKLVEFYSEKVTRALGLSRLRTRGIEIYFQTTADGALGHCIGDKTFAFIQIARTCPITKRKFSFLELMRSMTHELVHAKQFLRGELNCDNGWTWMGEDASHLAYDDQPWEQEAFRLEYEIFSKCFPWHLPFKN
jgi:hypothetical protein